MNDAYVSADEFLKLKEKVNYIYEIHSLDSELTEEEKELVKEAKKDIKKGKKEDFTSIEEI